MAEKQNASPLHKLWLGTKKEKQPGPQAGLALEPAVEPAMEPAREAGLPFEVLYDRYVQKIYRYLLSRMGNSEEPKDLTSQTFLTALEAFPRYRDRGYFAAWLFSIARSKLIDSIRREKSANRALQKSFEDIVIDPLQEVVRTERVDALRKVIQTLPAQEQELLRLRYVAELRFVEIAALLNSNKEAIKKTLYRLLARLQNQMER